MALKNKVNFNLLVDPDDPSTLILSPINEDIQDGSKYVINIKDLEFVDGSIYSYKQTFLTPPEGYYVPIEDVKDLIHGLDLNDENILRHIIEAGKTATYLAKRKMEDTKQIPDHLLQI